MEQKNVPSGIHNVNSSIKFCIICRLRVIDKVMMFRPVEPVLKKLFYQHAWYLSKEEVTSP
jgi:hypothetical protein